MSLPEEFKIHIEPDGRIVLERGSMSETSYKKILEYLQETMGPIRATDEADPLAGRLSYGTRARENEQRELKLGEGGH